MPIKKRVRSGTDDAETADASKKPKKEVPPAPAFFGEDDDDKAEWNAIAKFVDRGKGTAVKDKGKRLLGVKDKLPSKNPIVHELEVKGTRYAIVKIITLG